VTDALRSAPLGEFGRDRSLTANGLALSSRSAVRVVSPGLSPIIESHTESFN
jgi:hypothetical protein